MRRGNGKYYIIFAAGTCRSLGARRTRLRGCDDVTIRTGAEHANKYKPQARATTKLRWKLQGLVSGTPMRHRGHELGTHEPYHLSRAEGHASKQARTTTMSSVKFSTISLPHGDPQRNSSKLFVHSGATTNDGICLRCGCAENLQNRILG